jgi:hypothetical protein
MDYKIPDWYDRLWVKNWKENIEAKASKPDRSDSGIAY